MSYHLDKKEKRKKYFMWSSGALVFLILLYFGVYAVSVSLAHTIFRPVFFVGGKVGSMFSTAGSYFSTKSSLRSENEKLQKEIATLQAQILDHTILVGENLALKEILNHKGENRNLVLAGILGRPNRSLYDVMLVDAGKDQGVFAGQKVFAHSDIPVGYVAEVFNNSSKVILFSSPDEKIEVNVSLKREGKEESEIIFAELVGRGGGNFEMTLPRDFVLEKGSLATLPGISGFVVAIAETVISDPRDSFQKAIFISPVNLNEIKFVQIEI